MSKFKLAYVAASAQGKDSKTDPMPELSKALAESPSQPSRSLLRDIAREYRFVVALAHRQLPPDAQVMATPRERRAPRRARVAAAAASGDDLPLPLTAVAGGDLVVGAAWDCDLTRLGPDATCSPSSSEAARGLRRSVEGLPPSSAMVVVLAAPEHVRDAYWEAFPR
jgi:hypothetical protein